MIRGNKYKLLGAGGSENGAIVHTFNDERYLLFRPHFFGGCASLFHVHIATCVLHFGGVVTAIVLIAVDEDWSVPVVTSYADWRQRDPTRGGCDDRNCFITPVFGEVPGRISLMGLVAAFHGLSFAWQFFVVCGVPGVREMYIEELKKQRNWLRWAEYGLSAPLMTIVIAIIFGVVDVYLLSVLAICTSGLQAFGYMQEIFSNITNLSDKKIRFFPIIVGSAFFLAYWSVVGVAFTESVTSSRAKPPAGMTTAIWTTFFVMTGLFSCFAIVLAVDVVKRHERHIYDYVYIEGAYCILSATSKWALGALLIWVVWIRETQIQLDFVISPSCDTSPAATLFYNVTSMNATVMNATVVNATVTNVTNGTYV